MTRTILWIGAGLLLGLIIHLIVVLSLPGLASNSAWDKISRMAAANQFVVLDQPEAGTDNPFLLDPELAYAVCQIDLREGPGVVSGILPDAFWSVTVFDRAGRAVYGTTNRSGIGQSLQLGIFNPAQTRLLAEQQLDITEGLLVVEARSDDIFVSVRIAPAFPALIGRYREALAQLSCGNAAQ